MAEGLRALAVLQGTWVHSQHPHGSSQQSATLVPEDLTPSSGLHRLYMRSRTCRQNTHTYKSLENK